MSYAIRRLARRWGRFGITTRLMAGYTLILALAMAAVLYQSDRMITQRLQNTLATDMNSEVQELTTAATTDRPAGQSLEAFTVGWLQTHSHSRTHLVVMLAPGANAQSTPLTTPTDGWLPELPKVIQWQSIPPATVTVFTASTPLGTYRVQGGPLMIAGRNVGSYVAASSLDALNTDRQEQLALAGLEGLLALVAALGAGYLLLRRALRTVNKVTEAANEATQGDLSKRLSYQGPEDEVGRLARTVDAMLTQLDASFTAQRRLLADVSHQLRTPLTVARGHLEVLARQHTELASDHDETVTLVIDELTQMSLMVDRLLMLGQALEPDFLLEESIDLPALLHEVFEAAQVMAPRNWVLEPVPDITIWADRAKLRGALLNLVDNAVKATSLSGTIQLTARAGRELRLEVSDDGRGISGDDQRQVFDRFRRFAQSSYGGSGLGLAIVKAVAEAHGGQVHLTSAVGEGCRVVIALPTTRIRPETAAGAVKAGAR